MLAQAFGPEPSDDAEAKAPAPVAEAAAAPEPELEPEPPEAEVMAVSPPSTTLAEGPVSSPEAEAMPATRRHGSALPS